MYRLTARLLLLLLLVSLFTPAAWAISAPAQHDCCTQKCCKKMPMGMRMEMPRHTSDSALLQASGCCHQDCRCSPVVSHYFQLRSQTNSVANFLSAILPVNVQLAHRIANLDTVHSGRAPPAV